MNCFYNMTCATLKLASWIAPEERKIWARAMITEISYIPTSEHGAFAFGCLSVSTRERIVAMNIPTRLIQGLLLSGCALLALLGLANGAANIALDPAVGIAFFLSGTLWAAAFACAVAGARALLARLAAGGIAFYVALGIAGTAGWPAFESNPELFQNYSLEGISLFAVLLAVASVAAFWPQQLAEA